MAPLKRLRDRLSHCKHNCTSCINGTLAWTYGIDNTPATFPGLGVWKKLEKPRESRLLIFPAFAAKRFRSCRWESQKQMVISSNDSIGPWKTNKMIETDTNRDGIKSCFPKFQLFLASVSRGSSNLTPRINVAAIDDLQDRRIVVIKSFQKSLKLILFTTSK